MSDLETNLIQYLQADIQAIKQAQQRIVKATEAIHADKIKAVKNASKSLQAEYKAQCEAWDRILAILMTEESEDLYERAATILSERLRDPRQRETWRANLRARLQKRLDRIGQGRPW